ncbi:dolichol-phosphate mannosyltransferase [Candidatus Endolissoclinum faulkneri L5]|uniref:Dolichol-phosphate mannosyltransferase n=1 Tax=Candidatus Endolissoclinum faulkneri L5 TaxID=1401328 RepID=V9TWK0_9PROT|nr:dolichol-phosphate mannosyltransferase [Candidatus Endolissoclinum faulkneri L5]
MRLQLLLPDYLPAYDENMLVNNQLIDAPSISVIIPVRDEAGAIANLLQEVLDKVGAIYRVQVIVVDDGSCDGTDKIVKQLAANDSRIILVRHAKRSNKSAALRTGAMIANSLWMATIDGDGENDPTDVLAMVAQIDATKVGKVGLVAGVRRHRTAGLGRLIASRIGNFVRQILLRDDCPDAACGLKVVLRPLFLAFPYFDSLHRYMPALTKCYGYETLHVLVDDRPRRVGRSKYNNSKRALVGIIDLLGVFWLLRRTTVRYYSSSKPTEYIKS